MKLAEHSTGVLSEAYRQRAEDLADKDAQRKVGWDVVGKQVEAATMASQVPQAQAQERSYSPRYRPRAQRRNKQRGLKSWRPPRMKGRRSSPRRRLARPEKWHRGHARCCYCSQVGGASKLADKLNELIAGGKLPTPEQVSDITNNANAVVARKAAEEHSQCR